MLPILSLLLISCLSPVQLQDSSISFSPTSSICVGDTVSISCYGYPTEGMELEPYAEIILTTNVNLGITLTFTINSSIPGYSVTGDIPVEGSSARLQLTILSYQLTLSNRPIQCRAYPLGDSSSYLSVSSHTPPVAGYPYYPYIYVSTATPPSAVSCPIPIISWSPHSSANIDRYYLFRTVITGDKQQQQELLSTTTDSQYIINHPLNITLEYKYFVMASNCVGNSSTTNYVVISFYVVIGNLSLSYKPRSNLLSLDWDLSSHTFPRYIRYSLQLTHSPTQEGDATTHLYIFSRLTTENSFLTKLPNTLPADANISVCIEAVGQCGQLMPPYMATKECGYIITATAVPTLSSAEESTLALSVLFVVVFVYSLFSAPVICLLTASVVHLRIQIHRNIKPIPDYIAHF